MLKQKMSSGTFLAPLCPKANKPRTLEFLIQTKDLKVFLSFKPIKAKGLWKVTGAERSLLSKGQEAAAGS